MLFQNYNYPQKNPFKEKRLSKLGRAVEKRLYSEDFIEKKVKRLYIRVSRRLSAQTFINCFSLEIGF